MSHSGSSITLAVSATLYATPHLLSYLCSAPERGDQRGEVWKIADLVDQLRTHMAKLQEGCKDAIGDKGWFILTQVFADNAWISFVAFTYLARNAKPYEDGQSTLNAVAAQLSFCTVAWLGRKACVTLFPSTKEIFGSRYS